MKTQYFSTCCTLEEVKRRYKELALQHHPDRGGDTAIMQEINLQYENIMKNPFFSFAEKSDQEQEEFIRYPEIINQIIGLEGIIIELIGNWIWLSGNTYLHRAQLKQTGFYFTPKKVMWYYRPADYKSANKKPKTIEYIRSKYGTEVIQNRSENMSLSN